LNLEGLRCWHGPIWHSPVQGKDRLCPSRSGCCFRFPSLADFDRCDLADRFLPRDEGVQIIASGGTEGHLAAQAAGDEPRAASSTGRVCLPSSSPGELPGGGRTHRAGDTSRDLVVASRGAASFDVWETRRVGGAAHDLVVASRGVASFGVWETRCAGGAARDLVVVSRGAATFGVWETRRAGGAARDLVVASREAASFGILQSILSGATRRDGFPPRTRRGGAPRCSGLPPHRQSTPLFVFFSFLSLCCFF